MQRWHVNRWRQRHAKMTTCQQVVSAARKDDMSTGGGCRSRSTAHCTDTTETSGLLASPSCNRIMSRTLPLTWVGTLTCWSMVGYTCWAGLDCWAAAIVIWHVEAAWPGQRGLAGDQWSRRECWRIWRPQRDLAWWPKSFTDDSNLMC